MTGLHDMLNPRGGKLAEGDDLDTATSTGGGPYACTIAANAVMGALVSVTGGAFGQVRVTGAKWMARPGTTAPELPIRGDAALVVFDDNGDPWVVSWWRS
ncbi:MAG TPA: hypothetical protein VNM48_20995 [Chloroflexota bacterium]|nr:hypothetical protein [Chloroflexota bacterium]